MSDALKSVSIFALALLVCSVSSTALAQTQNDYFKRFDHNGDGKVSLDEFQLNMGFAFDQMDKNRDGILQSDEQVIPNAKQVTRDQHRERIAQQFRKQDQNKDGFLNKIELLSPPRR
jgi:Ca2+-binding EF-hand superfamily protein